MFYRAWDAEERNERNDDEERKDDEERDEERDVPDERNILLAVLSNTFNAITSCWFSISSAGLIAIRNIHSRVERRIGMICK